MLDPTAGRVVNVGSGAAGGYVGRLGKTDAARTMIKDDVTLDDILAHIKENLGGPADTMSGYGVSKASPSPRPSSPSFTPLSLP